MNKRTIVRWTVLSGIVLCFLFSLMVVMFGYRKATRTFLFPDQGKVQVEMHRLPKFPRLQGNIHALVQEMVLGPKALDLIPLFPRPTKVQSTFVVGREVVYIDFSPHVLYGKRNFPYSFQTSLDLLTQMILMNFHQITQVVVTVDGQLPGILPYSLDRES